jgi:CRISPR-associated protein Cas2
MQKRFVVVAYDIVDDIRRHKVAEVLEGYGKRVNYSVFECYVTERELLELMDLIEQLIEVEDDRVVYYTLCKQCINKIERKGKGFRQSGDNAVTMV